ncbi:MAG: Response regulator, contains domain [Bacteriovoracaceae bacterium]|nr:Response regulator, contains domain [Bacteriovoracaceae bacterium]
MKTRPKLSFIDESHLPNFNILVIEMGARNSSRDLLYILKTFGYNSFVIPGDSSGKKSKEGSQIAPDSILVDARGMNQSHSKDLETFLLALSAKNLRVPIAVVLSQRFQFAIPNGQPWIDRMDWPISKVSLFARLEFYHGLKQEWKRTELREAALLDTLILLREVQEHWEKLSKLDSLTDIPNRRCFDETFDRECRRAARENESLALLLVDIDLFKTFNDQNGHLVGDECLRQLAATISKALRRPADFVARYGGEEFACILPNTTAKGAWKVAEQIRKSIEELNIINAQSSFGVVTVSVGICATEFSTSAMMKDLFLKADHALYLAKSFGRNRIEMDIL